MAQHVVCERQVLVVDVDGDHVHAGRENLHGHDVGKLDGVLDQFALFLGEHALLFRVLKDDAQLVRGGLRRFLARRPQRGNALYQRGYGAYDGREDPHHRAQGDGERAHKRIGPVGRDNLGQRFAEGDQKQRGDDGRDGLAVFQVQHLHEEHGRRGGGRDVHQIVAHQNGGKRPGVVVVDENGLGGALVARVGGVLQALMVGAREGDFTRGEEGREEYEHGVQAYDGDFQDHAFAPPFRGAAGATVTSSSS